MLVCCFSKQLCEDLMQKIRGKISKKDLVMGNRGVFPRLVAGSSMWFFSGDAPAIPSNVKSPAVKSRRPRPRGHARAHAVRHPLQDLRPACQHQEDCQPRGPRCWHQEAPRHKEGRQNGALPHVDSVKAALVPKKGKPNVVMFVGLQATWNYIL